MSLAVLGLGCATGSDSVFDGTGGAGSGAGGASSTSTTATTSTTSTTTSTTSTTSATTSTSTTTSTTSSTSTGGGDCGQAEHLCAGICAGNTPQTGCFQSSTCAPCAAPPVNGTLTCTAQGTCDFTCNAGYTKNGSQCLCTNQCCTDADCAGGGTCVNGTCSGGSGACDPIQCFLDCLNQGCPGLCMGDVCQCLC